jgi:outer membrane lipoprotein-sorting protein
MIRLLLMSLALLMGTALWAQNNQYLNAEDSDPEAKAILEKVKAKYEAYKTIESDFVLDIEIPEQPKQSMQGELERQGDKYHLKLGTQEVFCDGKAIYFILHNNKEVQINDIPDPDEDDSILTPQSIFNFYESEKFVYFITGELAENGRRLKEITFKPLDRDNTDYAKLVLTLDKANNKIIRVKAYGKDASRYTFHMGKVKTNTGLAATAFSFDKTKFPGYYVEDLRE